MEDFGFGREAINAGAVSRGPLSEENGNNAEEKVRQQRARY